MFEIIMLAAFLYAATSQFLPEKQSREGSKAKRKAQAENRESHHRQRNGNGNGNVSKAKSGDRSYLCAHAA